MAEPSASESSADLSDSDQDFDPSAEMLVNDFDDEYTLEEEEAMESTESVTHELDDLQREGEMPLNEVLAMYGYESGVEFDDSIQEIPEPDSDSSPLDSPEPTVESQNSPQSILNQSVITPDVECNPLLVRKIDEVIELGFRETSPIPLGRPLLRSVHQASESSDTGTDYDYSADDDWRKTIQVGADYQAVIPDGLSEYDDAPAYENEDRLLWDPTRLPDEEVEDYLRQSRLPKNSSGVNALPTGNHVRDDEQALFLLLQCGYNTEEALRRKRMQPLPPADTMSLWSEEECRSFENGLKTYGKDFHLIQLNRVRTRSVSELVQFYYLWKKTERHDDFVRKHRIEKKKYALHPGITDFMDRFVDEQELFLNNMRDPSPSPTSNLPMFDEMKKLTPLTSPETNADSSTPELSIHGFDILDGPSSTSTYYSNGAMSTSVELENSPSKSHSGIPSDCSRDYMNGDDKVTSTTPALSKDDNIICLNMESLSVVSDSVSNQTDSEKSMQISPPSDVTCSHILNDISRFHEGCNFRFDYQKDGVSIE
ncbi:mesoderm induction early response protein 1 [Nephila pilipes]|uniref:Mesoderm induction early response protein 1 n=1 Tax=Nephila pilipes TaxID=299642 RepID=A0A8X6R179_NEPPI|nr:mesoderm induction early response protein 1 [Nephila pilipes]